MNLNKLKLTILSYLTGYLLSGSQPEPGDLESGDERPRRGIHFLPTDKLPKEEGYQLCNSGEEKE
jgi:hypothetical protein